MGTNPDYKRTRSHAMRVRDMLECGIPVWKIAKQLKVSENTIWRYYQDIVDDVGNRRGNQGFEPSDANRNQVKMMAAVGITQADIASFIGISPGALTRHFEEELRLGRIQADMQVGGNLFKMATGSPELKSTIAAAIWWTKARMGWKDTSRIENTGPDGGAIQHEHQVMIVLPDNGRGDRPNVPYTIEGSGDVHLIEHDDHSEQDE
jgi:hypothetical protein